MSGFRLRMLSHEPLELIPATQTQATQPYTICNPLRTEIRTWELRHHLATWSCIQRLDIGKSCNFQSGCHWSSGAPSRHFTGFPETPCRMWCPTSIRPASETSACPAAGAWKERRYRRQFLHKSSKQNVAGKNMIKNRCSQLIHKRLDHHKGCDNSRAKHWSGLGGSSLWAELNRQFVAGFAAFSFEIHFQSESSHGNGWFTSVLAGARWLRSTYVQTKHRLLPESLLRSWWLGQAPHCLGQRTWQI